MCSVNLCMHNVYSNSSRNTENLIKNNTLLNSINFFFYNVMFVDRVTYVLYLCCVKLCQWQMFITYPQNIHKTHSKQQTNKKHKIRWKKRTLQKKGPKFKKVKTSLWNNNVNFSVVWGYRNFQKKKEKQKSKKQKTNKK